MYDWLRRIFSTTAHHGMIDTAARSTLIEEPMIVTAPAPAMETTPSPKKPAMISALQRADVNANFTSWLFDDRNQADIFTNPIENDILAALTDISTSKQSGANLVRRMPGVIPQLLQNLRSENFSGAELARTISHDVVLVAAVVRLANSSMYNPSEPINSIERAILVLGQTGLRQLITSVAFKPILDLKSGHFTKSIAPRLWEQSEQCAIANRLVADNEAVEPLDAFLAGLAQNVGLIISLRVIDQMSEGSSQTIGSDRFRSTLVRCTRGLSCSIAREWRFPETVIGAIEEMQSNQKPAVLSPLGKILAVGDYLSKVHILMHHNRLNQDDARLVNGLSEKEIACLKKLPPLAAIE